MENKIKESKRRYGKIYNKTNITVQLNRELISKLKSKLPLDISIKSFIESLIKQSI
jgi:hypothetical protein